MKKNKNKKTKDPHFCSNAVCCTKVYLQMLLWPQGLTLIPWYFALCTTQSREPPRANDIRSGWVDPVKFMSTHITDYCAFQQ